MFRQTGKKKKKKKEPEMYSSMQKNEIFTSVLQASS